VGVVYGNPEVTTGGRALKFYASVRIEIRKTEALKSGSEIYGNRVRCKVVKNKVAPPFKSAEFDILYGKGISKSGEVMDLAISFGVIEKSGSWFSYDGQRIGQGKDRARQLLESNPELFAEIEEKVKKLISEMDIEEDITGEDDEFDLREFELEE
jgi:recombination protein RecA